jgi:hypothetical protein
MQNTKWKRTTQHTRCPICEHDGWCSVSGDGNIALCMREETGSFKTKEVAGGNGYLHRLKDGPRSWGPSPPASPPGPALADADTLHGVYFALLRALSLSGAHRNNLQGRGLDDDTIDRNQYRSLPGQGRAKIAARLREQFGDRLPQVPGFVVKAGSNGNYITIAGAAGLLIPCRDAQGQIVALKVRRDAEGEGPRYSYVSSTGYGGPGPGAPVHVPLLTPSPAPHVRLTEGELKSDIVAALGKVPTLSVPGVGNWKSSLPILRNLGSKTVMIAFDADAFEKPHVARHLAACADALSAEGLAVEVERWDAGDGKGIDDVLAAGKQPRTLAGDEAQATIREAVAVPGVDQPGQGPLSRLEDVLNTGGAKALFRDRELLQAIAELQRKDPPEFAAVVTSMDGRVKKRMLEQALRPYQRGPVEATHSGPYLIANGSISRQGQTQGGEFVHPLCNFSARIIQDVQHDDGAEQRRSFQIEGALAGGGALPLTSVSADEFPAMNWVVAKWGTQAVVYAGQGTKDHLRAALQLLSGQPRRRTVYGHLGWRQIDGRWAYLHAGGAVADDGGEDVEVDLPESLAGYVLPTPPTGDALRAAVCASLGLLSLGPRHITYPMLAVVYRAVLGGADFGIHLSGRTGCFKSEAAALIQQHFGRGMSSRHLPASWSSTGNALEGMAFLAKDAVMVVDDFCPAGSSGDVQRLHKEADRLFRGQGNRAGRQRMRSDATLRAQRPPRGLIVSTGEDVPRGQSLRARLLVLEIAAGDLGSPGNAHELTRCQRDAAAGQYASALAGFLKWLAPRYAQVRDAAHAEAAQLRIELPACGHARTPGIIADLLVGLRLFLDFALECGAIDAGQRDHHLQAGREALLRAGAAQAEQASTAEPAGRFLQLLSAAVAGGRAHLAGGNGEAPDDSERWGWRADPGSQPRPMGERVGWVVADEVFLDPDVSFACASRLANDQGDAFPITAPTLRRRMDEQGLLCSKDETRGKLTVRRTYQGQRRDVLHVNWAGVDAAGPEPNDHPQGGLEDNACPGGGTQLMGRLGRPDTGVEGAGGPNELWGEV